MRRVEDLVGKRFTFWRVVERAPNRGKVVYWRCRCDCGKVKEVMVLSLRRGQSKSCGCKRFEIISDQQRVRRAAKSSQRYVDFEQALREVAANWPASLARYAREAICG